MKNRITANRQRRHKDIRQCTRSLYANRIARDKLIRQSRDEALQQIRAMDCNDLGHLSRQVVDCLTNKLKVKRAVMLACPDGERFVVTASQGFDCEDFSDISFFNNYSPFFVRLTHDMAVECSKYTSLINENSSIQRLFNLGCRYWVPLMLSNDEQLIGLVGLEQACSNTSQEEFVSACMEHIPALLQSAILNYRMGCPIVDPDIDSSVREKLDICLHTTRLVANLHYSTRNHVYNEIIEFFVENFRFRRLLLLARNNKGDYIPIRALGFGKESLSELRYQPKNDIFGRLLKMGKLFELRLDSIPPEEEAYAFVERGLNFFVPLVGNETERKIVGFVCMQLDSAPSGYQVLISRLISTVSSLIINNYSLSQELKETQARHEHQINKLQMLYDVGRALGVIDNRTELLKKLLGHATEIVQAEKGSVMLLNSDHRLEVNVVKGIDEEIADKILHGKIRTTSFALGEGIAGTVALNGKPLLINDVASLDKDNDDGDDKKPDSDSTYRYENQKLETRSNNVRFVNSNTTHVSSILCVPLRAHNEIIGVINITNKKKGKEFTKDDLRIVEQVADQAAVAIHNARLYELAITDSLTKVYVRHQLFMRLEDELKRMNRSRDKKCVTVIMIDIDHFKSINDNYGHPFGDKVLIEVTSTLRSSLRAVDAICRYGGEEFCMILPDTNVKGGRMVARRIHRLLEKLDLKSDNGTQVRVSVSGGIAGCQNFESVDPRTNDGKDYKLIPSRFTVSDLIKQADIALYHSKTNGRNLFTAYEDIKETEGISDDTEENNVAENSSTAKSESDESNDINSAHTVSYESDMRSYQ